MRGINIKPARGPEAIIQENLVKFLEARGWYVKITHGNMYQQGFPDLYICKRTEGSRWVEVKNPKNYKFTGAQLQTFPRFASEGVGVWILIAATQREYDKLFKPPNWWTYLHIPGA